MSLCTNVQCLMHLHATGYWTAQPASIPCIQAFIQLYELSLHHLKSRRFPYFMVSYKYVHTFTHTCTCMCKHTVNLRSATIVNTIRFRSLTNHHPHCAVLCQREFVTMCVVVFVLSLPLLLWRSWNFNNTLTLFDMTMRMNARPRTYLHAQSSTSSQPTSIHPSVHAALFVLVLVFVFVLRAPLDVLLSDALLIVVRNCVVVVVDQWNFLADMSKVRSNFLKIRTLPGCERLIEQLWQLGTLVHKYIADMRWLKLNVWGLCGLFLLPH